MDFEKMRDLRKAKHKSQEDLAKFLGVNRATVSKYETGVIEPSLSQIARIADFLEVSQGEIIGIESFDTPADFERAWVERGGAPHNVDPTKTIPLVSARELMLRSFDRLNSEGQFEAAKRVNELTEIPKYQKEEPPQD